MDIHEHRGLRGGAYRLDRSRHVAHTEVLVTIFEKLITQGVQFIRKDDSWTMRVIGWVVGSWFMLDYVTTVRWPLCSPRIYYPSALPSPDLIPSWLLRHEQHHVWQFRGFLGWLHMILLWLTPYGRWVIERRPHLVDIRAGRKTSARAALLIRTKYRWPYPESWMTSAREMELWWDEHRDDEPQPW